jgi:hypothetical protein
MSAATRPALVTRPARATRARPQAGRTGLRRLVRDNGLSLALIVLFVVCMAGQALTGHRAFNDERRDHGQAQVGFREYLVGGHFGEATAENWESEFLQMAAFVWLTALLFQRGSAESKDPDGQEPRRPPTAPRDRPWPVRRGGLVRRIYGHSLGLAFLVLFLMSFAWHAASGAAHESAERLAHGDAPITVWEYLATARFWFESFQNWQSEFLAILSMTVLTIFLREKGSAESKEVDRPHRETGK